MTYNIIKEYIDFIKKSYLELFKIIFKNKYDKYLSNMFIDKYISVRYYNETNYPSTKDFLTRINKELVALLEQVSTEENLDYLKNIIALFGYIVYFDDVNYITEDLELINYLVNDDIVKIDDKKDLKKEIKKWYIDFNNKKELFNSVINSKDFYLIESRLYRKLYSLTLEHSVKISNLYSEYAIDKTYNSGIVNEDKAFVTYILASSLVLNNAINLDFSKHYMLPFPSSLFEKEKKMARLLNIIDNDLARKCISIKITYTDYIKNKKVINDLINEGYFFCIELDSKYTGNVTELFLFPYVLVYNDTEEYEMLLRDKENLKSKIIKL